MRGVVMAELASVGVYVYIFSNYADDDDDYHDDHDDHDENGDHYDDDDHDDHDEGSCHGWASIGGSLYCMVLAIEWHTSYKDRVDVF